VRLYDYSASANCYKPRLLFALLGREYERVEIDIFAGETLTDEYRALNPAREVPVLELDDGTALPQSNAILWFLAEGTTFLPDSPLERARVIEWLIFEQERVMSGIGSARFRILTGRGDPKLVAARVALGQGALEILQTRLAGAEYLVGSTPTIADVANYAYTHVASDAGFNLGEYPAVRTWLRRVEALPGFINDLEPYPDNARPGKSRSIYDE
jgi:glutathione S-transferase